MKGAATTKGKPENLTPSHVFCLLAFRFDFLKDAEGWEVCPD